ncbi:MAG: universal stress protein [bacterium]
MITLSKILCPVDFSEYSKHALTYAVALAAQFRAKLTLVHVIEPIHLPADIALGAPGILHFEDGLVERARARLDSLVDVATLAELSVETRVLEGVAFAEIVKFAREENTDLIVLATHGQSGIAQLLLGSTAEKVVRKAPCPVLTVKSPEHEFVTP